MSSVIHSSFVIDLIGATPLDYPMMETRHESLSNPLSVPLDVMSRYPPGLEYSPLDSTQESHESCYSPRLSDNQTEADKVLINMLMNNVPRTIIRSILESDSYDILVPPNPSIAPYLVISYADDTEDGYYASINNTRPIQDCAFLMVPRLGVTATDRNQNDYEEEWHQIGEESEAHFYSTVKLEELELDYPEWPIELEDYFSGHDRRRRIATLLTDSARTGVIPIGFEFTDSFDKAECRTNDWSDDYVLGTGEELDIDEGMDSSLELYGNDTESDFTEFSDSE